jgi:hypothetical protein
MGGVEVRNNDLVIQVKADGACSARYGGNIERSGDGLSVVPSILESE